MPTPSQNPEQFLVLLANPRLVGLFLKQKVKITLSRWYAWQVCQSKMFTVYMKSGWETIRIRKHFPTLERAQPLHWMGHLLVFFNTLGNLTMWMKITHNSNWRKEQHFFEPKKGVALKLKLPENGFVCDYCYALTKFSNIEKRLPAIIHFHKSNFLLYSIIPSK